MLLLLLYKVRIFHFRIKYNYPNISKNVQLRPTNHDSTLKSPETISLYSNIVYIRFARWRQCTASYRDRYFHLNVKVSSFWAFLIFYERTFILWRSHGKQHREIEAIFTSNVIVATDTSVMRISRWNSIEKRWSVPDTDQDTGEKVSEKTEKGEEIKLLRERGKKSAIKMAKCLLTVSTAIYLEAPMVFDITRACIAIDGSENPFWGMVRLMVCFACETLRQSGWWRVIICEMINWTEKISRHVLGIKKVD